MTDLSGIPFETGDVQIRGGCAGRLILARLKPNQDLVEAIEEIATQHDIRHGTIRSAVRSIINARFVGVGNGACASARAATPGSAAGRHAVGPGIEILEASGEIIPADTNDGGGGHTVTLRAVVSDRNGTVFAGMLKPGHNRTLITVELCIEEWFPATPISAR